MFAGKRKIRWFVHGQKNGKFTVKVFFSTLESRSTVLFSTSMIWNSWVPPKVSFFAWEATWAKVLTLDDLRRRGWCLANRCFLCQSEEEFIDHILIHCVKTRGLWNLLFSLFGVFWVFPFSVKETFRMIWSFCGKTMEKDVAGYSPMLILDHMEGKK